LTLGIIEMNTIDIEQRLARIEELLVGLNNTTKISCPKPSPVDSGMMIKYDSLAEKIKNSIFQVLQQNGIDTQVLKNIPFEDIILSTVDVFEYNSLDITSLEKRRSNEDVVDICPIESQQPSVTNSQESMISEKSTTTTKPKATKPKVTKEQTQDQDLPITSEPKVTKPRTKSAPLDKEAKEAEKKAKEAEKQAKEAEKQAEKEAKEAQKKAEKEAKDAQKKAEKEAKDAQKTVNPTVKGNKSKKTNISSQSSSQSNEENIKLPSTPKIQTKPNLPPLIHPDKFKPVSSTQEPVEEDNVEYIEEEEAEHSSEDDNEDEDEDEDEEVTPNFTILTNYSIPSKPEVLYCVQKQQYIYECIKTEEHPEGLIDWNKHIGMISGSGKLVPTLNYKNLITISK